MKMAHKFHKLNFLEFTIPRFTIKGSILNINLNQITTKKTYNRLIAAINSSSKAQIHEAEQPKFYKNIVVQFSNVELVYLELQHLE